MRRRRCGGPKGAPGVLMSATLIRVANVSTPRVASVDVHVGNAFTHVLELCFDVHHSLILPRERFGQKLILLKNSSVYLANTTYLVLYHFHSLVGSLSLFSVMLQYLEEL